MEDILGRQNVNFSIPVYNDKLEKLHKKQRMERGFDDSECINLDMTIVKFIIPRLRVFIANNMSYPVQVGSPEEWTHILNGILEGLELYIKKDEGNFGEDINEINGNNAKIDEALNNLFKYFKCLWI